MCQGEGQCWGWRGFRAGAHAGVVVSDPKHPVPQTGGFDQGRAAAHVYRITGWEPGEKSWRQSVQSKR